MTILQGYLYADVAQGGTVTISYPAGFAPDAYDQAGAMACMLSVDSSMPVGNYSLAWGGSSVVVTNNKGVWKAGVSLFVVVPDVIFGPSSGGVAATITGSYVVGQVLTVVIGPGLTGGTYQWTRDGANISGATASTYTLATADAGKVVTCVISGVTYTAIGGAVPAGEAAVQPLRVVSARNNVTNAARALSGLTLKFVARHPYPLGGTNISEFVLDFFNFYVTTTAELPIANAFTLEKVALEYGATSVPVTFAGKRSVVVGAGAVDVLSDPVSSSSLPLPGTHNGAVVWVRMEGFVSVSGDAIPIGGDMSYAGSFSKEYNPGATTITNGADGVGPISWSGSALATNSAQYCAPMLLGRFESGDPLTLLGYGDSITMGSHDAEVATYGIVGPGGLNRATHPYNSMTNIIPIINCGRSGAFSYTYDGAGTLIESFENYANTVVEGFGVNDFAANVLSAAQVYANCKTIWDRAKANGVTRIVRMGVTPRCTTSTDFWATLAGQTPNESSFNVGQRAQQFNALCLASVGADITHFVPSPLRDPTEDVKWIVNGTANYATDDGTHPVAAGCEIVANALRPLFATF